MQGKMKSDGGNDDERLEVGNNLQLNTEVEVYGNKARAKNSKVSIIRWHFIFPHYPAIDQSYLLKDVWLSKNFTNALNYYLNPLVSSQFS